MPVTAEDIKWFRSSIGDSEGGIRSLVQVVNAQKNNLFPDVSDTARLAGGQMIRKIFLVNEHPTDALLVPAVWVSTPPPNLTVHMGLGFDDGDDDISTAGTLDAWTATAAVALISDGNDTRPVTVYGLNGSGVPTMASLSLNGATQVVTGSTFSKVWGVMLDSKSTTRTVTIRQGAGGATRGTIPVNTAVAWTWVAALSQATGIRLPNLVGGGAYGFWLRVQWGANAPALRPADLVLSVTETT